MPRAVVARAGGPPTDVLRIEQVDGPGAPGRGQVLVRVSAFPLHPGDLQAVAGRDPSERDTPMVAGLEALGIVEAIGPDTAVRPGVDIGSRVAVIHPGAWQERLAAGADLVAAVPAGVSDEVGAQMLINPLTAQLLRRAVQRSSATGYNGVAIQTAAGSSVARLLTAMMVDHGEAMINVVRSAEAAGRLADQFPTVPVVSTAENGWVDAVRRHAAGRPITAALDPVGGPLGAELLKLLSAGGTLVAYSSMVQEPTPVMYEELLRGLDITQVNVGRWHETTSSTQRTWDIDVAEETVSRYPWAFAPAATYDLGDLEAAIAHVVKPGKTGMIVVRMS
jgi:NADPH:quinone reductase-like Zn-dependent oxidoreductase